jgi:hypothetical protein
MAETVKTRDGTVDDPCLYGTCLRIVSTAQIHTNPTDRLSSGENSSETMTYLTLIALMMLVLSPVLIPLVITAIHIIGDLRTA